MKSNLPKVLHPLAGRPMVHHVINTARQLGAQQIMGVVNDNISVQESFDQFVVQQPQLGTGHATQLGYAQLQKPTNGVVLILYGDTPLLSTDTLQKLCTMAGETNGVAVLGFNPQNPGLLGRLLVKNNQLQAIIEAKDATPAQLKLGLCNSGVMAVSAGVLHKLLPLLNNNNASGEYYLTDIVQLAVKHNINSSHIVAPEWECMGVNSQAELAECNRILQNQYKNNFMANGVQMPDPQSVIVSFDTEIAPNCVIEPFVHIGVGVKIGPHCQIRSFSYLEKCQIDEHVILGPYARVRPQSHIMAGAHIGNFVEIKKSLVHKGAKINHLSYIGDAEIGAGANIGAGTITCNYDGKNKYKTIIGQNAFIGSNSALVAPVEIGNNAIIGAGSVIRKNVPNNALAVARGEQKIYNNYKREK